MANELTAVIGLIIFILFPSWVVYVAVRKDHPGLAVLTFATIFVGLGPLVGTLTLLRVSEKI
jgi:hypothetical protein